MLLNFKTKVVIKMEKAVKGMENLKTTVETKSISLALANKMIEAALVKGKNLECHLVLRLLINLEI